MYRSLLRARLPLVADSLYSPRSCEARSNVVGRMEFSRMFVEGLGHFRSWEQSVARSMQVQIVNALCSGERDQASKLLSNLGHGNGLRDDDFLFILDYCARSPDPLAFNWLTFLGGNHDTNPNLRMYNIFLNGCAELQSSVHADYCLELMEGRQMGKSEITYCELLKLAVLQQNLSAVHEIWKDCIKYYNPSIISLRKFVWSFARLSDLRSAYNVLQRMVALALKGSASVRMSADGRYQSSRLDIPIPLNKRCGMTENGYSGLSALESIPVKIGEQKISTDSLLVDLPHIDNATEHSTAIPGNIPSVDEGNNGSSPQFSPVADVPRTGGLYLSAKQVLQSDPDMVDMELDGGGFGILKDIATLPVMKILRWSFSDVIHACARSRNCELAEQLFLQMDNIGLEPSQHTFDGLVKVVVSERGITYGMKVVKEMEKRSLKPYSATLATLLVGYSRSLELDLAEALLDQIVESSSKHIHPFNALLAACDAMDQPERAVRVLAKMKHLKIKYDIRTYELLFSLFGNVNAPYEKGNMLSKVDASKRIRAIEMDMVKNGVQHSRISMENLLKALGAEGMIRELIQYLQVADNQFCHTYAYKGTVMYNTVLHALVEAKESHNATEVFKNMKSCDLPPDAATYNIMIDCCSIIRCFKSASALVSLMIRDGFSPETCTYTALIKILLANEDFDEALNLLDQASTEGIQLDVLLFNTILLEAYLKGRIDIIELIVERMHQEKIQPDPATCSYAFSAYVDRGFLTTAIEALQVLSMRMISEEESVLQDKRIYFEELVLDEDPEAESRITKIFKESGEYLASALLNLRWCAITGFSISWSPNESLWARRLSSTYGPRTPASWKAKT
ncbi:pentatricopeptide repeat-containing protein At1g76280 isoform X2 [Magnolia sinica]|uniref:pentatricopeptide repeat-containing protein At1g76280 isoform X2 n=1 Tax=Magnolia sinica TaxID=86752 RepID=UPI00265ABED2|nr:pentatricopeptide repeat-containing protein At1g76280 isoform X2 [Magnolia sinica]